MRPPDPPPSDPPPAAAAPDPDQYVAAVHRAVVRALAGQRRPADADDIAVEVCLTLCGRLEATMRDYPNPAVYALAVCRNAAVDHDRRERSQRGEGARLDTLGDGDVAPRRTVVSGDATGDDGSITVFGTLEDAGELLDEQVANSDAVLLMLRRALVGLSTADRQLLYLVDGLGYTITEIADTLGLRRETLNRRITALRRMAQANTSAHRGGEETAS